MDLLFRSHQFGGLGQGHILSDSGGFWLGKGGFRMAEEKLLEHMGKMIQHQGTVLDDIDIILLGNELKRLARFRMMEHEA